MASVGWALLLFLAQLHSFANSKSHADANLTRHSAPSLCHPDQADILLKLKRSFLFDSYSITTLPSWQPGSDCCLWEGVRCSNSSGHVTALDLSGIGLHSNGIDSVIFNLTSLSLLDLSMNDFGGMNYRNPSDGFEKLSLLTHLNLSNAGISGQIPKGISKLTNLLSLDLSCSFTITDDGGNVGYIEACESWEHNFQDLVANLSNLRELKLDGVFILSRAEDCFKALAKSVPHLRVLSMDSCELQGHIDHSLSRLQFLSMINLSNNFRMTPGPFPEFFMYFLNLSVLRLARINLEGWLPPIIFQSKNLRVLDLSGNLNLSGNIPKLSNVNCLETLKLHMTNFSYGKSNYFINSKSLMELGLDGKIISMDFLSSFGILDSLRKVILTGLDLQREMESAFLWIEGTKKLTSLEFFECDFSVTNSSIIGNSKNLRSLSISDSNIKEQTLSAVANLKTLKTLSINNCGLLGKLPSSIGNMSSLEVLNIFDCQLSGPMPHEIGQIKKLTSLILGYTGLSGTIPGSIGNLTQLTELAIYFGHLSGEIPTPLFSLPALQVLDLQRNKLSGPIQEFNVVSSHLYSIDLSINGLTGQIPQSFFVLTSLRYLDIAENNLTGSVDLASFWRLNNLTYLSLSNNKLSVMDGEVCNYSSNYLSGLTKVGLASCSLTKLPSFLMRLNHVASLDLSCNNISGDIPSLIWERWNSSLESIDLSQNIFTGIQLTSYVIPFSNILDNFDVSSNRLRGQIPMPSSSAWFLDYSNNSFSSVLPNFTLYLNDTNFLSMSRNNISGYLPHSICDASALESLDLAFNNFRGLIPACLIEKAFVIGVLNLRENHFEGVLPSNISSECSFQAIDLHGNDIEGHLPKALYNCSGLEVLDLGRNKITDTFPSWLGGHLNLRVLILRSNQFHGSLDYPKNGEYFPRLQTIDLASNNFSGNLHPQWFQWFKPMEKYNNTGQYYTKVGLKETVITSYKGLYMTFEEILTTVTSIDLSDNALEGTIPGSIGKLVSLRALNMSHNSFTGQIPRQLGGMTALELLDLSSNMLSGEIPEELTNLTFLSILNLSNNQLEGTIPRSRQFLTFENSSFDGNAGICGPPLSKQCGIPDTRAHPKSSSDNVDVVLFLFAGVGFGVGFAAAILMKQGWNRRWFCILRIQQP
ncbi:unnamed protein product [Urochloa decumbens]|uniref:Leucine-rich repeat-containing N-terminal plant-type domain-containing protein n=1 Tax=Urochloa decumbens TaxID=240449 RepID=A0ABC9ASU9_9POAL